MTAFRYKFGSFIQQIVAVGLNNQESLRIFVYGQSNVVFRGRFVVCSGDLCVVDNAGRQAIVVERALLFRSAVAKAFVVVLVVVVR